MPGGVPPPTVAPVCLALYLSAWARKRVRGGRLHAGAPPVVVVGCSRPPEGTSAATWGLESFDLDRGLDAGSACGASFFAVWRVSSRRPSASGCVPAAILLCFGGLARCQVCHSGIMLCLRPAPRRQPAACPKAPTEQDPPTRGRHIRTATHPPKTVAPPGATLPKAARAGCCGVLADRARIAR